VEELDRVEAAGCENSISCSATSMDVAAAMAEEVESELRYLAAAAAIRASGAAAISGRDHIDTFRPRQRRRTLRQLRPA
jgi:hypothetical protein